MHKSMKSILPIMVAAIAIFPAAAFAAVVDATWIGPSTGGTWTDAANWDAGEATGYPSGAGSIARFTNSVTVASAGVGMCEVYVADSCTVTHNATSTSYLKANSSNEVVFDIGENATFKQSGTIPNVYADNAWTLVKKGKGTISFGGVIGHWSMSGFNFKTIDVRGGVFKMACAQSPRVFASDNYIRVREGATLIDVSTGNQQLGSTIVVDIDEGGTLDFNGKGGTLRGIIGTGTAKLGGTDAPLTLRCEGVASGSQGTFTGTISGNVIFAPTNGAPFVVRAADTIAAATISTVEPAVGKALEFAAGIGKFKLKNETVLGTLAGYTTDAVGEPLTWQIVKTADYTHTAAGDDDWSNVELVASGNVTEKSGGTWTIGSISMAAEKTFAVDAAAGGSEIHFCGGTMTNVFMTVKSDYALHFDGVNLSTVSFLTGANGRSYHQTDGLVELGRLSCASALAGPFATNSVFYFISGGTLVSKPVYYQFGLGLEASGDAQVRLLNNKYNGNTVRHALANATHGYILRIRGNANVYTEGLNYYYYAGSAACTAGVEIAENGVLELAGNIGSSDGVAPQAAFSGFLRFDGGTLRTLVAGDHNIPDTCLTAKDFVTSVGPGGATIDVPRTNFAAIARMNFGFTNRLTVADGGITKKGLGSLSLGKCCISGPVSVVNGRILTTSTGNGGNALGTGSLRIGRGIISMKSSGAQKLASGAGATVTMVAPGAIRRSTAGETPLEIGPAGASSTPIRRENHAVLAIACAVNAPSDSIPSFDTYPVRINGGIGDMPVFAWERTLDYSNAGRNAAEKTLKFLACDAEGNLSTRVPDYLNEFPEGGDSSAFVRIATNQTVVLTANKHVGCLDVYGGNYHSTDKPNQVGGIRISPGVTLTVGKGAGTIAKVLMNNNYRGEILDFGESTIAGEGTLDFGAAEGLFAVNYAFDSTGVRRPAHLLCKVAGTGGVTFASPYTMDSDASGDNVWKMRAVYVAARNTYSGGTWIDGLAVAPGTCDSFGSGTVSVQGDDITGGELLFLPEYTGEDFTNALTIAGHGFRFAASYTNRWCGRGAVVTMRDVALAGGVSLAADSTMFVGTNATLTLASAVTGSGSLTVKGPGTLAISAPITCAGGVEYAVDAVEIRPGTSGTLSLDAATIPASATLVAEGSGAADGCGTLVVDGDIDLSELNVRFGRRSDFKGNRFELVRATGTISGVPDESTLPSKNWSYEVSGGTLVAVRDSVGTILIVE